MVWVILIVCLSIVDAHLTGYLLGSRMAVEANPIYPDAFLICPWGRGIFAALSGFYFWSRGWSWVLFIWVFLLFGVCLWNLTVCGLYNL